MLAAVERAASRSRRNIRRDGQSSRVRRPLVNLRPFALGALALAAAGRLFGQAPLPAEVTLTRLADRVRVEVDGKLFTEYIFAGASRPYLYPVLAPDGTPLTRNFPMKDVPGEEQDHPWHRSLFFAHSNVNQVDFWNEGNGDAGHAPAEKGAQEQDQLLEANSGPEGILIATDRWVAPDGRVVCTDIRRIGFHADASGRYIDFDIALRAPADSPLTFGDNKDGTMAIRLAEWMTMPHKVHGALAGGHGHILDANGDRDEAVWGKRADWCDYSAARGGRTYGVAIFDNPANIHHPTWWMARDYGLFGANPFGQHDYEHLPNPHAGDVTIPPGGTLRLRYRFFFHDEPASAATLEAKYRAYIAERQPAD